MSVVFITGGCANTGLAISKLFASKGWDVAVSSRDRASSKATAKMLNAEYDIIVGNVADDDVFKTVDMYFRGLWDKQKVLEELRYYKMNNQICIVKQEILEQILVFKGAYEV